MKRISSVIAVMVIGLSASYAQGSLESGENTAEKNQQQIMDDFNSRSSVIIKFYPNPATNFLNIEPVLNSDGGTIKIYDITGRLTSSYHLETGSNGLTIDLSQYIPGLYVLAYYDASDKLQHVNRFYKN